MENFEQELMKAVEHVVFKKIAEGSWVGVPIWNNGAYPATKQCEVSREYLLRLFSRIDMDRISNLVLSRVEERIADKIFNALATEVANDTKAIMCDGKARDAFRAAIRTRIAVVCHEEEACPTKS